MNNPNIKSIIFDLGGVIINLDPQLTFDAFKIAGAEGFESEFIEFNRSEIFDEFEKGQLSPAAFRTALTQQLGLNISEKAFDNIWNKLLLDIPNERINLIRKLSKKYQIYLLSNTNAIHMQHINNMLQEQFGWDNFNAIFHKAYLSYEMGLIKPDPAIFETIINNHQLSANETLFIDDSAVHTASAQKLGINTIHFERNGDLQAVFKDYY